MTKTIDGLTATTSAAAADELAIWRASNADTRKITKANFILDAARNEIFAATTKTTPVDADSMPLIDSAASNVLKRVTWANIKATLKTYFDTLHGSLATINTWALVQTFTSGITIGSLTINTATRSTWSPAITGSSSNPTITYTTQTGEYFRLGNSSSGQSVILFSILISINTVSGGAGTCRISVPVAVASVNTVGGVVISGPDATGTPFNIAFETESGQSYGNVRLVNDNASLSNLAVTDLAAGDLIRVSGFYFA